MGNGACIGTTDPGFDMTLSTKKKISIAPVSTDMSTVQTKSWFAFLYERYFPKMVIERFADIDDPPLSHPERQFFQASCAFVDISGFTKLSEKLATEYGENGAEMLNKFISGYFERLIEVILEWGGDIIKFAGDAMLVVWRNKKSNQPTYQNQVRRGFTNQAGKNMKNKLGTGEETTATLVLRAVACNLALIENLNNFSPTPGITLSMHCGIGCGELSGLFVGGVQDCWEFFVAGVPIQQMSDACEESTSGQVVISSESYKLIDSIASGNLLKSGNFHITSINDSPQIFKIVPAIIHPSREETLLSFIPKLVRRRVEAGHSASWLAEYRKVFIMFVKLPAIDYSDPNVMDLLQGCVCAVQESIFSFEGMIARLLADDKGTRFKIAFGMPANTHEDDGERVILAAMDIQFRLSQLPIPTQASIGIACGTVFCGEAGSSKRCEYTGVGYKVNMAARLMQAAGKGGILCEQVTYDIASAHDVDFERLPPIKVKGMSEPVAIFKPIGKKAKSTSNVVAADLTAENNANIKNKTGQLSISSFLPTSAPKRLSTVDKARQARNSIFVLSDAIVGRTRERNFITSSLSRLWLDSDLTVLILEGDGGVGKSVLMLDAVRNAEISGIKIMTGECTPAEKETPFYCFRNIFERAFGFTEGADILERTRTVKDLLEGEDSDYFSLLNSVCNVNFLETQACSILPDDSRAKQTRQLLILLFEKQGNDYKILVAIEDLNYMDSASWYLLIELVKSQKNVMFILSCRPFSIPVLADFSKLVRLPCVKRIAVDLFKSSDTAALVALIIKVRSIPNQLETFVFNRTKGHPLYIEEICKSLVDRKLVTIDKNGECDMSAFNEKDVAKFPDSVEGMIVDRIDHLPPGPELTLKTCAVLGKEFTLNLLADVHPTNPPVSEIITELNFLVASGFLQQESGKGSARLNEKLYSFKNGFFQEVAYNLLLLVQRKAIHVKIVEFYEANYAESNLIPLYGLLAVHLEKAEEWWPALVYAEKAASTASKNSSGDVCGYYKTAIRLLKKFPLNQVGAPKSDATQSAKRRFRSSSRNPFVGDDEMGQLIRATGRRAGQASKEDRLKAINSGFNNSFSLTASCASDDKQPSLETKINEGLTSCLVPNGVSVDDKENEEIILPSPPMLKRANTSKFHQINSEAADETIKTRLEKCHISLAEALFSKGKYEEALENFKIALESINPDFFPSSSLSLTLSYMQLRATLYIRRASNTKLDIPDNVFELTNLVKLLFRVASCCLYESSEASIFSANYYTCKCLDLADRIHNYFIQIQAYAQAAYTSLLVGKVEYGAELFKVSNTLLIEHECDVSMVELAIVKMKFAIYMAAIGSIEGARLYAQEAKSTFIRISSHRKLRECYMLLGVLEFFRGNFITSLENFNSLLVSAVEDGDSHLEMDSRKWIAIIFMATRGNSKKASEHLEAARDVYKDQRKVDFTLDVCSAMNEYYMSQDSTSISDFVSSLFQTNDYFNPSAYISSGGSLVFSSDGIPIVSEFQNSYFIVLLVLKLLDCVDFSEDGPAKKVMMLSQAKNLLILLECTSKTFALYKPFTMMMQARSDWLTARSMDAFIVIPFNRTDDMIKPLVSEDCARLQRSVISNGRNVIDICTLQHLDGLLADANYYMYLWAYNEPPPEVPGFFSKLLSQTDESEEVNKVLTAKKDCHANDNTCKKHFNATRALLLHAGVEFFRHPTYPLLHTRDDNVLIAHGFNPQYLATVDKNNDAELFSVENKPVFVREVSPAFNFTLPDQRNLINKKKDASYTQKSVVLIQPGSPTIKSSTSNVLLNSRAQAYVGNSPSAVSAENVDAKPSIVFKSYK